MFRVYQHHLPDITLKIHCSVLNEVTLLTFSHPDQFSMSSFDAILLSVPIPL